LDGHATEKTMTQEPDRIRQQMARYRRFYDAIQDQAFRDAVTDAMAALRAQLERLDPTARNVRSSEFERDLKARAFLARHWHAWPTR
jgi:hypothetical protein